MNFHGMKVFFDENLPKNEIWFIDSSPVNFAKEDFVSSVKSATASDLERLEEELTALKKMVYAMNFRGGTLFDEYVEQWKEKNFSLFPLPKFIRDACGCKKLRDGDTWKTVWHEGSVVCEKCGDPMP